MIITAIKSQVKNPGRISVYLDSAYSFSLSKNQLLETKLKLGQVVDGIELAELKQLSDYGKLLERTLNFVLLRPHSKQEIVNYLGRKKVEAAERENIISYLTEHNYVDDVAFAKAWVRWRQQSKQASRRRLVIELRQKGVDAPAINSALEDGSYDEQQALMELIAKKRQQTRYQNQQKLMQYLARQGFSFEDIKNAMRTWV